MIDASQYASLQDAINATPEGGKLFIPIGDYPVSGTGAQLLIISKGITIQGEGRGSRIIVASSVPATTDVIRVFSSTGEIAGLHLSDFSIQPESGNPARFGINLDANLGTNPIADGSILRVSIGEFGAEGIAMLGPTPPNFDGIFTFAITECSIRGGLLLDRAGDSLTITANKFWGGGQILVNLIGQGSNTAHGFVFMFNNVTCSGGIRILNSWQGAISYNNIELYDGAVGSNGAVINLEGNVSIPPENFEIRGNYIGPGPSVPVSIRVNHAAGTRVEGNMLPRGTGKTVLLTGNADRTQIMFNRAQPYGELISSWLEDNGTNTSTLYVHPNTGKLTLTDRLDVDAISVGGGTAVNNSNLLVQYIGEIVTTASTSDSLSDPRIKVGATCLAVPYNPVAADMTGVYAAAGNGIVTLVHPAESGGGFSIFSTGN